MEGIIEQKNHFLDAARRNDKAAQTAALVGLMEAYGRLGKSDWPKAEKILNKNTARWE